MWTPVRQICAHLHQWLDADRHTRGCSHHLALSTQHPHCAPSPQGGPCSCPVQPQKSTSSIRNVNPHSRLSSSKCALYLSSYSILPIWGKTNAGKFPNTALHAQATSNAFSHTHRAGSKTDMGESQSINLPEDFPPVYFSILAQSHHLPVCFLSQTSRSSPSVEHG